MYRDVIFMVGILFKTHSSRNTIGVIGLLALAGVGGCSKPTSPWDITHPTTGQVTFKGAPIADAELSFFPEDKSFPESVRPKAKSSADGKFIAWTYVQGDGVPVGSYKVTVVHNAVSISKGTIVANPNDLPVKYSRLDTTDLKVQVAVGKNEIPSIDLK